jgi:hypothetical protein
MSAEPKPTSLMRMIERQAQPHAENQVVKDINIHALAAIKKEAKWDLWFANKQLDYHDLQNKKPRIEKKKTQHDLTQHEETQHEETQHEIQREETQHETFDHALAAVHLCTKCIGTKAGTKGCRACMGESFEQIRKKLACEKCEEESLGPEHASSMSSDENMQVEIEEHLAALKKDEGTENELKGEGYVFEQPTQASAWIAKKSKRKVECEMIENESRVRASTRPKWKNGSLTTQDEKTENEVESEQ